MKISLILILIFFSAISNGEFGNQMTGGHFSRPETGPTATPLEKIEGHCQIVPGNGNMMSQPCGNMMLTLKGKGGDTLYTRTNNDGTFEFNVPSNRKYKIGVNSSFYEVLSPLDDLEQGEKVEMEVRQSKPKN